MSKLLPKGILLLGLLAMSSTSFSADLIEVFQQASVSDPDFKAATAQRLADHQQTSITRAFLMPSINGTANSTYNILNNKSTSAFSATSSNTGTFKYNSNGFGLGLEQPIFDYNAWAQYQQSKVFVKAADAQYAAAVQDLMRRVSTNYFAVLNAEDDLRYIKAEKRAIAQQLDQVRQQYKVGLVAITGVYQAQAQYDLVLSESIAAENTIQNNKENLRAITGVYYKHLAKLKGKVPLVTPIPNNVNRWVTTAGQQNWLVQAAHYTAETAKSQIRVEQSGHFPVLNAVAAHERNKTGNTPSGQTNTHLSAVGFQLSIPIFEGFLVSSLTEQSHFNYQKAIEELDKTYRSAVNATHQNFNNVIAGISKIKADRQAIMSNKSSLDSTTEAYKVGTQTMLDVLQAQQDLSDAQRIFARDQYGYIDSIIALKEAAGTLSIADLEEINTWLSHKGKGSSVKYKTNSHGAEKMPPLRKGQTSNSKKATHQSTATSKQSTQTTKQASKKVFKAPTKSFSRAKKSLQNSASSNKTS